MVKFLRLAATAALVCLAFDATADQNLRGRTEAPAHEAYKGLKLPVYAGVCAAVTGTETGDVCFDSTNDVLYVYGGSAFVSVGGSAQPGQNLPTYDPAATTDAAAQTYWVVTGYETNEKVWATSAGASLDEDGDLAIPAAGSIASAGQVVVSKDPSDTTAANASLLCDVSAHETNELCFATSDGAFSVDEDGDLKALTVTIGSTAVTASAAEINKLDGAPIGTSTISCADDAGGTTSLCTVQLKDADGSDLAVRGSVFIYLSADANGDAISAAPSGGWAITTDGLLISQVTNLAAQFISESDGDIDFTITEAGALTLYVIMVLPNGKMIASSALVFDA